MTSCPTTTRNTADQGGNETTPATITAIHPDIIQAHILTRLDGPTLASTSCASSQLNTLCYEEKLWKNICNSCWPSTTDPLVHDTISTFPSGHRSFFSDAVSTFHHPLRHHSDQPDDYSYLDRTSKISRLISAVDIHFEDKLICSRVFVTETTTSWFSCSPFRVDLLEQKEMVPTQVTLDGAGDENAFMERVECSMRLSWILMDPDTKRALNVSSIKPLAVGRHWLTGEFQARYATVVPMGSTGGGGGNGGLVQCRVVVGLGGKEGREMLVKEVSMLVEDMEGLILSGKDGLVILQEAMEEDRRMRRKGEEKERYEMFVKFKRELNDKQQRREKSLDMVCIATGIMMMMFMAFWTLTLFRLKG